MDLNQLQQLANQAGTQFNFRLPSGDIVYAGINPDQAATVEVEGILSGAVAADFGRMAGHREFKSGILGLAQTQLAGRKPVFDPRTSVQDRPGIPDVTPITEAERKAAYESQGLGYDPKLRTPVITPGTIQKGVDRVIKGVYGPSTYKGPSIVDYLSSIGKPSDYTSRANLAQQMGIQGYTGTAEQNTQLLNTLRGFGEYKIPERPGITAVGLDEKPVPFKLPPTVPTDTSSVIAGAEATSKSIQDYINLLTPEVTGESKEYDRILSELEGLIPAVGGRGAAQIEAEAKEGIGALKKSLADVNAEILRKTAEYKALSTDIEGKPITMQSIIGAQAQIQKVMVSDIGLLQAQALGLQGQLEAAQDSANRAVDLKYQDAETAINIRFQQLELLEGELTKSEKIRSDAISLYLQNQKDSLDVTKANEKDKNVTLLNLLQKYPDAGITLNDTLESANEKVVNNSAIYRKSVDVTDDIGIREKDKPMTVNQIEQFRRSYDWSPPPGFTWNQLIQYMNDNPGATPEELEEGAKRETEGVTPIEEVEEAPILDVETTTSTIMGGLSDEQLNKLKKLADEAGVSKFLRGKQGDVKDYLVSIFDKIQEATNEGYELDEIIEFLTS